MRNNWRKTIVIIYPRKKNRCYYNISVTLKKGANQPKALKQISNYWFVEKVGQQ